MKGREPNTIDWSLGARGRVYPAKGPGTALAAAPAMAVIGRVERMLGVDPFADATVLWNGAILNWLLNAPASALAMVLLFRRTLHLGIPLAHAVCGVLAIALGTAYFAYATSFYAHDLAANLVIAAGFLVLAEDETSPRRAALAGALAGYAVLVDYPAALFVLTLAGVIGTLRRRALGSYLLGGAPMLALFLGYHAFAFGTPFTTAYAHQNPLFATAEGGFLSAPSPRVLVSLVFGPFRGILFYSPALVLAGIGAARAWREGGPRLRVLAVAAPCLLAAWLLLNASYRVWWGGATTGPRFVVPALPLLAPLVALGLARAPRLGGALIALSIANYLAITSVTIFADDSVWNPLLGGVYPFLARGLLGRENLGTALGLRGAWSLLPLALGGGALATALARAVRRA